MKLYKLHYINYIKNKISKYSKTSALLNYVTTFYHYLYPLGYLQLFDLHGEILCM